MALALIVLSAWVSTNTSLGSPTPASAGTVSLMPECAAAVGLLDDPYVAVVLHLYPCPEGKPEPFTLMTLPGTLVSGFSVMAGLATVIMPSPRLPLAAAQHDLRLTISHAQRHGDRNRNPAGGGGLGVSRHSGRRVSEHDAGHNLSVSEIGTSDGHLLAGNHRGR